MNNLKFASEILNSLAASGVRSLIVCPGARCAPIIKAAQAISDFEIVTFFDERSAAFFALGRSLSTSRPVAVVTTSGGAVANCLPAVAEAKYSRAPLVIVSADRPRAARGTGAPQTMEQPAIFSGYTSPTQDFDLADYVQGRCKITIEGNSPAHINLCFDEPLLSEVEGESTPESSMPSIDEFCAVSKRPIVIAGPLVLTEARKVLPVLAEYRGPVYCESLSNLRGKVSNELKQSHLHLSKDFSNGDFDGVIRVGHVPCLRYWRDLEKNSIPVISFSDLPFSGLAKQRQLPHLLRQLPDVLRRYPEATRENIMDRDKNRGRALTELLDEFPLAELSLVHRLAQNQASFTSVFLGNSLAIREWDIVDQSSRNGEIEFVGQRGLNGIDGLISHAMGHMHKPGKHLIVLGDLSALYDLNALWALDKLPHDAEVKLAVINNGGGKIFRPMFKDQIFENPHALKFAGWAKMFGMQPVGTVEELITAAKGHHLLEISPDAHQSEELLNGLGKIQ